MRIARAVLVGLLALPAHAAAEDPPPPAAASPEEAARGLREALSGADEETIVEALAAAQAHPDPAVVREVRRALARKERAVRHAAVDALGRMRSKEALDALHALLQRDRSLPDDEELFALTLREIGRHGDKRSVPVLLDDVFEHLTVESGTARLMALANIRDGSTVDGLLAAGKKTGGAGGRGLRNEVIEALRPVYRAALVILTGHDEGVGGGLAWERWWKDYGKKVGVAPARPPAPAEVRAIWETFWREPYGAAPPEPGTARPVQPVLSPTPQQVQEAVAALSAAFDAKDDEILLEALQRYGGVRAPDVVHEVARGLRSRSTRVRWVTIDVLGWSGDPRALKQLHRLVAREPRLSGENEALFAHLLKAIGRHGSESSIEVLTDHPLRNLTYASGRARILGLARIRSKRSVEELMKAMTLAGDRPRRRGGDGSVPRFLGDFRLALLILTGEDLGPSKEAWLGWWRKADRDFQVSETPPSIPPSARRIWEEYWDEPYATVTK